MVREQRLEELMVGEGIGEMEEVRRHGLGREVKSRKALRIENCRLSAQAWLQVPG